MTAAQSAVKELDLTRNDEDDLFDAVLTGSVDKEKSLPSKRTKTEIETEDNDKPSAPIETSKITTKSKRIGLYIGKFPWWITQEDLTHLLHNLGVRDIIEIKFAENKVNGLSKGYSEVVVRSEGSMKLLLDKIPKCKLGGETMTCRYANRFNLSLFEDMSKQSVPGFPASAACSNMNDSGSSFLSQNPFESTMPQQFFNPFVNTFPSIPNPFLRCPAPPLPHMLPPPLLPMVQNFMKSAPNLQTVDQHSDSALAGTSQEGHSSSTSHSDEKTDKDFEDLINRNRAVASAAINKAVTGATTGDLRVAMETLLTAISIIKQSRVYQDDRCQALVTSLKDCLMSIQGSCGYSRHSEERKRDRRKSSSSERRHSLRRNRDRSWSRERSGGRSREHSRDWDRHRDRDRYRERYY